MPQFTLETIEDHYTYYVQLMGIPEDVFWHAPFSFLERIVENKTAYDAWHASVLQYERERNGG
ncbi:MAG: hypothetical protein MR638_10545 [Lachnospiraceae bacterium]|nr:hypothetical protein [Lachnospiraceae bacterium]